MLPLLKRPLHGLWRQNGTLSLGCLQLACRCYRAAAVLNKLMRPPACGLIPTAGLPSQQASRKSHGAGGGLRSQHMLADDLNATKRWQRLSSMHIFHSDPAKAKPLAHPLD